MKQNIITLLLCSLTWWSWAQPTTYLAITKANVVDVNTGKVLKNHTVLIRQGKIIAIHKHWQQEAPYRVINAAGGYLIPGLIDAHVHVTGGSPQVMVAQLQASLKQGITAVRDMGGDGVVLKKWQKTATELGIPSIYFSAVFAGDSWIDNDFRAKGSAHGTIPGTTAWLRKINPTSAIAAHVKAAKSFGVTGIKIYADLPLNLIQQIVNEAHKNKLRVWSHATIFPTAPQQVITTKLHAVSHGALLLYALKDTIPITYHLAKAHPPVYSAQKLVNNPRLKMMWQTMKRNQVALDATLFIHKVFGERKGKVYQEMATKTYEIVKQAYQNGVKIMAGTDALYNAKQASVNLPNELLLLTQKSGLSYLDALRAATLYNAQVLGIDQYYGSIAQGKVADLVLLKDNPLENIAATKKIVWVMKSGKMVK